MAKDNKVIWTVLPNDKAENGKLRLTVLATLQLQGGDTDRLQDDDYKLFQDWPKSLVAEKSQWVITFSGASGSPWRVPSGLDYLKNLDSQMWQALFRSDLGVRPRPGNKEFHDSDVGTYPAKSVNQDHKDLRATLSALLLFEERSSELRSDLAARSSRLNLYLHPSRVRQTLDRDTNAASIDASQILAHQRALVFLDLVKQVDSVFRARLERDVARLERSIGRILKAEVILTLIAHHRAQIATSLPQSVAQDLDNKWNAEIKQQVYQNAQIIKPDMAIPESQRFPDAFQKVFNVFYPQVQFALFHYRPELYISGISPQAVPVNRLTTLTVSGNGFRENLRAAVKPAGSVTNVRTVDSMKVQLEVTVPAAGPYTLTITNLDGQTASFNFTATTVDRELAAAAQGKCDHDFHQVLSMVGQFPVFLRPLGLAFDLEVDAIGLATGTGTVEAKLVTTSTVGDTAFPEGVTAQSMKTKYRYDGANFFAEPKDASLLFGRMLNVTEKNGFSLAIEEIDGSNLKDLLHAEAVGRAEDLMLGYRVDIWDDYSNKWHSLCERTGSYRFLDARNSELRPWKPPAELLRLEEGFVQAAVTVPHDAQQDSQKQLQVHHALFSWHGWSLSVPLPAKPINRSQEMQGNKPLRMEPEFMVKPSSLPPLRYGATYKVRCRAVDIAGNSKYPNEGNICWPSSNPNERNICSPSSNPITYQRWEPVRSPVMLLASPLDPVQSPGEQMDRLVIRDGHGQAERFMAPPRIPQHLAETHSEFDKDGLPDGAFRNVVLNLDGSFPAFSESDDAKVAERNAYLQYDRHYNKRSNCDYFPDPLAHCVRIKAWRLDIIGKRTMIEALPDFDLTIPFVDVTRNRWPDVFPIRLRTAVAPGAVGNPADTSPNPRWGWELVDGNDPQSREVPSITMPLRRAEAIELEISCVLPSKLHKGPEDMVEVEKCLALFDATGDFLMRRLGIDINLDSNRLRLSRFTDGTHSMISPPHKVRLVHAVRKPLVELLFKEDFKVQRQTLNANPACVYGEIQLDWFSTARLVCDATYTEWIDDLAKSGPEQVTTREQAFEIKNTDLHREPKFQQHAFRDTKYHEVE